MWGVKSNMTTGESTAFTPFIYILFPFAPGCSLNFSSRSLTRKYLMTFSKSAIMSMKIPALNRPSDGKREQVMGLGGAGDGNTGKPEVLSGGALAVLFPAQNGSQVKF